MKNVKYSHILLNFTKKAAPRPHHLLEDGGWRKAGKSTDSLGAVWSWACTSTHALLTARQNPYTTCDETQSTAKLHHHHLTKLSRNHQRQPLCLKCTKEQSVAHHTTATTTAPEALGKLPATKRKAFQKITPLVSFVAAEEIPASQ